MSNVIIKGESIRTKRDAEKCLKDHDATFLREGWREHEARRDEMDKKCDAKVYDVLKSNSYGKYYGVSWKPGQWEKVFGKKDEGRDRTNEH